MDETTLQQARADLAFVAMRFEGVMALAARLEQLGSMEALAASIGADLERLNRVSMPSGTPRSWSTISRRLGSTSSNRARSADSRP